jgi:hypothetical protein
VSDNDFDHPSYAAPFNYESTPTDFNYLRPGAVNAGFSGQAQTARYDDDDGDDD